MIEQEIITIQGLNTEYREMSKPVSPDEAIGRLFRMGAINNKSVTEQGLRLFQNKLKNLKNVLIKLPNPEFGICQNCKQ